MASVDQNSAGSSEILQQILSSITALRQEYSHLATAIDTINGRVNALAGVKQSQDGTTLDASYASPRLIPTSPKLPPRGHQMRNSISSIDGLGKTVNGSSESSSSSPRKASVASKIILTSYPGQAGVDPLPMHWGEKDPQKRGRKSLIDSFTDIVSPAN